MICIYCLFLKAERGLKKEVTLRFVVALTKMKRQGQDVGMSQHGSDRFTIVRS